MTAAAHAKTHPVPAPQIHIVSRTFAGGQMQRMTIFLDGEYYTVNDYLLAALRRGETVEELGLEPEPQDDADDDYDPASWSDFAYQARREEQQS